MKKLRKYQEQDIHKLLELLRKDEHRVLGVHYGTGAGKTLTSLTLANLALKDGLFEHVLILCPTTTIKDQFVLEADSSVRFSSKSIKLLPVKAINGTDEFLNIRHPISVTTQQLAVRPDCLASLRLEKRKILVITDEAHRSPLVDDDSQTQNRLGRAEREWAERGLTIMKLSGSPFREDGFSVLPTEAVVERDLAYLMMHGYAPSTITSEVLQVDAEAYEDEESEGVLADPTAGVQDIVEHWKKLGNVPGIVRIKSVDPNVTRTRIEMFNREAPGQIISCYRDDVDDLKEFQEKENRDLTNEVAHYREYQNLIIGVNRIAEGLNSPSRCVIYLLGIPRSFPLLIQAIGRAMRKKVNPDGTPLFRGYPKQWLDRAHVVFVVGRVEEEEAKERHLTALFRVVTTMEGLNYAGALGRMFRSFYDRQRRQEDKEQDDAVILDPIPQEVKDLKNELEKVIRDKEIPGLVVEYDASSPADRLRKLHAWFVEKKVLEAKEHGMSDTQLVKVRARAEEDCPDEAFKALIAIDVGKYRKDDPAVIQWLKARADDQATLIDALLELYEEFKDDVMVTRHGVQMDAYFISLYRSKAKRLLEESPLQIEVLRKQGKKPRQIAQTLKRPLSDVLEYLGKRDLLDLNDSAPRRAGSKRKTISVV